MVASNEFFDILTAFRIRDPARAADGYLYDHASLTAWFEALDAAGLPIVSPRTSQPMERTLVRDAEAREELLLFLEDLALNNPGVTVKTLAVLRVVFDVLDRLENLLNAVLEGWKVRLATRSHSIRAFRRYPPRPQPSPAHATSCRRLA